MSLLHESQQNISARSLLLPTCYSTEQWSSTHENIHISPQTPVRGSKVRTHIFLVPLSPILSPRPPTTPMDGRNRIFTFSSFLSLTFQGHILKTLFLSSNGGENGFQALWGEKLKCSEWLNILKILSLSHLHSFLFLEHMVSI